jgi:cytochrome c
MCCLKLKAIFLCHKILFMNTIQKLIPLIFILILFNCGDTKNTDNKDSIKLKANPENSKSEQDTQTALISQGKKLFNSNACAGCHMPNNTAIGPSIKAITTIYAKQNADYIAFFKGKADPIVDTDPNQVFLMKTNLDSYVKNLSDTQLEALIAYMKSVD